MSESSERMRGMSLLSIAEASSGSETPSRRLLASDTFGSSTETSLRSAAIAVSAASSTAAASTRRPVRGSSRTARRMWRRWRAFAISRSAPMAAEREAVWYNSAARARLRSLSWLCGSAATSLASSSVCLLAERSIDTTCSSSPVRVEPPSTPPAAASLDGAACAPPLPPGEALPDHSSGRAGGFAPTAASLQLAAAPPAPAPASLCSSSCRSTALKASQTSRTRERQLAPASAPALPSSARFSSSEAALERRQAPTYAALPRKVCATVDSRFMSMSAEAVILARPSATGRVTSTNWVSSVRKSSSSPPSCDTASGTSSVGSPFAEEEEGGAAASEGPPRGCEEDGTARAGATLDPTRLAPPAASLPETEGVPPSWSRCFAMTLLSVALDMGLVM
mmetsp:Transcript_14319/g.46249  ORF Transcript_14319/g.46249 Transcript_14319/m.46249 type:complete len:395 (-) Transcript_14319:2021-3205(-)